MYKLYIKKDKLNPKRSFRYYMQLQECLKEFFRCDVGNNTNATFILDCYAQQKTVQMAKKIFDSGIKFNKIFE